MSDILLRTNPDGVTLVILVEDAAIIPSKLVEGFDHMAQVLPGDDGLVVLTSDLNDRTGQVVGTYQDPSVAQRQAIESLQALARDAGHQVVGAHLVGAEAET